MSYISLLPAVKGPHLTRPMCLFSGASVIWVARQPSDRSWSGCFVLLVVGFLGLGHNASHLFYGPLDGPASLDSVGLDSTLGGGMGASLLTLPSFPIIVVSSFRISGRPAGGKGLLLLNFLSQVILFSSITFLHSS